MARVATFEWRTPPPTSIEELLAVYDDGSVVLVVRCPRTASPTIGSYAAHPTAEDHALLAAAGPGPVTFDLLAPTTGAIEALMSTADRVAADSLDTPRAVVTFHAHAPAAADGGRLGVTLLAVAAGYQAVEFELDPAASSVHFQGHDGQTMSWQDLPELPMGFVTPQATSLGGIVEAASIAPGAFGAIAFEATPPAGARAISILVSGWLRNALPDEEPPERFRVRTATVPIPG